MTRSGNPVRPCGALAVLVVLAVSGCVAPTSPTPTALPIESGSPTPTVSPTPTPGPAARVVISPTGISVEDADGRSIDEQDFAGDAAGMVAMLTSTFGTDPDYYAADPTQECGGHNSYSWQEGGTGLVLFERVTDVSAPFTRLDVRLSTASLGGLPIITSAGLAIGDDGTAFVATLPAQQVDPASGFIWEVSGTYESSGVSYPFGGMGQLDVDGTVAFIAAPGTTFSFFC